MTIFKINMKKIISIVVLTFCFLLTTFNLVLAQPTIQWEKSLGGSNNETANSIEQTTDGGYIVAGGTSSNDGDVTLNQGGQDCWVVKLDANGNMEWEKTYGGTGNEFISSILETSDGGYIFAASTLSNDGDVSNSYINWDYWIVKIDSIGNIVWEKSYGGSSVDITGDIKLTVDGGFIVVGYTESNDGNVSINKGNSDYWIIKIDSVGNLLWEKSYGGSNGEVAYAVIQTNDLGYMVVGESTSNDGDVSSNYGGRDYWVVKLDSLGNLLWEKNYGGSGFDRGKSVLENPNGGYIVAGRSNSIDTDITGNKGIDDYWIVNIDSIGNIQWQSNYGGTAADDFQKITNTSDGGFIMVGTSGSSDGDVGGNYGSGDYWVVKIDSIGNIEWEKNFGGSAVDFGYAINQTNDNGFIISGLASSTDIDITNNIGAGDFWLVKLDAITGIEKQKANKRVSIFPNPTKGKFTIELENTSKNSLIVISDLVGKVIFSKTIIDNTLQIDISNQPKGIYLVKIINGNNVTTQKIVYQ
jgi:hypothetical protein